MSKDRVKIANKSMKNLLADVKREEFTPKSPGG